MAIHANQEVFQLVRELNDVETALAVRAERAFLARIGGDCSLPVGAHATISDGRITMGGMIGLPDGNFVRGTNTGPADNPETVGIGLAELLLDLSGELAGSTASAEDIASQ